MNETPDIVEDVETPVPEEVGEPEVTHPPGAKTTVVPETADEFLQRVKQSRKTTRLRFYLGGKAEWVDMVGFGVSADQLAAVNAELDASAEETTEGMEEQVRILARIISDSVSDSSFPIPMTYAFLCSSPYWFLEEVWEKLQTADQHLPKDRLPKAKGKKGPSRKKTS